MRKRTVIGLGMFGLGVGYFVWYIPYSALAKALSGGLSLPGVHHPVGGLVLLPATVLGQLVAMPFFVASAGWLRYPRRRMIVGRSIPFPARYTAESSIWMAFIVGTTTLNFTFPGASIVFMLVLMRITTLVTAPVVDLIRRRKIHGYSSVALLLCALSAIVALTNVGDYKLTVGAILSVTLYATGYYFRFRLMSVHAKSGDLWRDRQYLVEEAPRLYVVPRHLGGGSGPPDRSVLRGAVRHDQPDLHQPAGALLRRACARVRQPAGRHRRLVHLVWRV